MKFIERIPGTKRLIVGESKLPVVNQLMNVKYYKKLQIYDMLTGELICNYDNKNISKSYHLSEEHILMVFRERSRNGVSKPHKLSIIDPISGQLLANKTLARSPPVFSQMQNANEPLFLATYHDENRELLKLYQVKGVNFIELAEVKEDIKPRLLIFDENKKKFMIVGKHHSVSVDLKQQASRSMLKNPFDIATGFFSENGDLIYLREGTGSEVGIYDYRSKQMINESGTGRAGVKFSQFIGTVLVASVTAYAGGYAVIPVRRSDTAMITDDKEKSLFVINAKTNDVTIFDAKKLNGRKSLATGNGTFGVFKFDKEKFPNHSDTIYVVSYNKLSYIN